MTVLTTQRLTLTPVAVGDMDELIGLSDTLQVMLRGAVVATLDPGAVTPEQLGGYMTGAVAGTTAGAA